MSVSLRDLLPYITTRMTTNGLIYFEDDSLVVRQRAGAAGEAVSWLCMLPFHYGVYEWMGKLDKAVTGIDQFLGLLERRHGWINEGGIYAYYAGAIDSYAFVCTKDGQASAGGLLTDQDWTRDTQFKVDWRANAVIFYVDGVEVRRVTDVVPQKPMNLIGEINIPAGVTLNLPCKVTTKNYRVPKPAFIKL
jgi:hypothetical protein